jgi:SIS domain
MRAQARRSQSNPDPPNAQAPVDTLALDMATEPEEPPRLRCAVIGLGIRSRSGRRRDHVAVAISTSGRSPNVLAGAETARSLGLRTIGLTGAAGGELATAVDLCLHVPSEVTARVQEGHIVIAHVLCELVEQDLA